MMMDAMVQRCPRAPVEAPDDDLLGQAIQPALNHIEYTPVAHSCAKETSQLGKGEQWCSRNARNLCTIKGLSPYLLSPNLLSLMGYDGFHPL